MKVILHVCKSAPGLSALKHNYRGKAARSKPERYFQDSRVQAVIGDTCGLGVVPRKPGAEKSLLELLSGPNAKRPGKPLRQLILSSEDVGSDKPDDYYAMVLAALLKAAKKWIDTYAPGCRWAAWAHEDRAHPHVHVVFENWDYARGKRLNLSPTLLEEMQGMGFCSDLGIESGRGSRGQIEAGLVLLAEGKLESDCTYQERIQIQAATQDNARMAVAAQIENWRKKLNLPPDVNVMRVALEEGTLPNGWTARTRSHKGALYQKPSVIIDGVAVRLNKFVEMRERLPNLGSGSHSEAAPLDVDHLSKSVVDLVGPEPTPEPTPEPVVADTAAEVTPQPTPEPVSAPVLADPVVQIPLGTDSAEVESAVVESVAAEPVAAEPVVAEPVVAEPVVAEPVVAEPVAPKPVAPKPEVAEPMVAKSEATPEPAAPEPKPLPVTEPMPAPGLAPEPKPVPLSPSRRRIRRSSEPEMGF